VGPFVRRVECQHDIFFGDAERHEIIGNAFFRAIVLNPDLVVLDIDMDKTSIHSLPLTPPYRREQIMIPDGIKKELSFEVPICRLHLAISLQDLLHLPTVVI
jgi:hypothetical protein